MPPLFGKVKYRTESPIWVRGDHITFLEAFDTQDVTKVHTPQLVGVPGTKSGNLRFHKREHAQLKQAFVDFEKLSLLHHISSCAGALNTRLPKPTSGGLSKLPSNHAFGTAIDLNSDDDRLGASVTPIAPVFEVLGFHWGISFDDPMHFEVDELIEDPDSVSVHLVALLK